MNFCPTCEFMLFTKIDTSSKKILNYCKNCNWSGDYIKEDDGDNKICIYKKNYDNDFMSNSIHSNPFIVYDNTLPRINNIKCINDNCLSNINRKFTVKMTISYKGNIEDDIMDNRCTQNIKKICSNILKTNRINEKKIIKTANDTCIIVCNLSNDKDTLLGLTDSVFGEYDIKVTKFKPANNEIIFIKYNDKELKYMYVCVHCKSSWKN